MSTMTLALESSGKKKTERIIGKKTQASYHCTGMDCHWVSISLCRNTLCTSLHSKLETVVLGKKWGTGLNEQTQLHPGHSQSIASLCREKVLEKTSGLSQPSCTFFELWWLSQEVNAKGESRHVQLCPFLCIFRDTVCLKKCIFLAYP